MTLKSQRAWQMCCRFWENRWQPRLLYLAKLFITINWENRTFHDKVKFKWYPPTKPALQKLLEGFLLRWFEIHPWKHRKQSQTSKIKKETHTYTYTHACTTKNKQQQQGNRTQHWSLILHNSPIKRQRLTEYEKQNPFFCCTQEAHLNIKDRHHLRVMG